MKKLNWESLIISISIPLIIGGLAGFLTMNDMSQFYKIEKPELTPPAIVFPIVWTILYILMGISAYLVKNSKGSDSEKKTAMTLYIIQLGFNFFWSILFFRFDAYLLSFIWLVILWLLIILMIKSFGKVNKLAALLQIPYLLWVTLAGYLNLAIYLLNS